MTILITEDNYFEKVRLTKFVEKYNPDFNIVFFDNYNDTIEYAKHNTIHLAMLDIKIHEDNGYKLAEELRNIDPSVYVCFVSGYSEDAINAFKLQAVGFIEKPYNYDEVCKVLDRFMLLPKKEEKNVYIKTFGKFEVYIDDELVKFSSAKAKELLAYLVHNKGSGVSLDELVSNIFGGDAEKGYNYFRIIFHRLKKTLKDYGIENIIEHQKNNYYVNKKHFKCDLIEVYKENNKYYGMFQDEYMEGYSWNNIGKEKIKEFISNLLSK
jgi:two-component SAPR family response regulator